MKTAFKWLAIALAGLIAAAGIGWLAIGKDWRTLILNTPTNQDVLFWEQDQRDAGFRYIDRIPSIIESREIANGDSVHPLPKGEQLYLGIDLAAYMESQNTAAITMAKSGLSDTVYVSIKRGAGRAFPSQNPSPQRLSARRLKTAISIAWTISLAIISPPSKARPMMMLRWHNSSP